jgi:nicotinamide mononucleotide adenylyltransferase
MDQSTDSLARWRHNIHLISQLIQNDVSSTKVRLFLRRGLSVRYLLPAVVVQYIEDNGLYLEDGVGSASGSSDKGKEKDSAETVPLGGVARKASQS